MSPEAQRVAIAEACGWREAFPPKGKPHELTKRGGILLPYHWVQEGTGDRLYNLPDYLNDLNAMAAAEKILNWDEQTSTELFNYRCWLTKICGKDRDLTMFASAAQRAEAFLRVKRLWTD